MIWTIHAKSDALGNDTPTKMVAVPERSGLLAFMLPFVWLAWQRLWFALAVYALLAVLWFVALTTDYAAQATFMGFVPGLYVWLEGSQLRRAELARQGYEIINLVDAPDMDSAVARVAARQVAVPVADAPAAERPQSQRLSPLAPQREHDSVGLFGT